MSIKFFLPKTKQFRILYLSLFFILISEIFADNVIVKRILHSHENDDKSSDDQNETLILSRFGNNSEESQYLELWETKCLGDVYEEILKSQHLQNKDDQDSNNVLENLEEKIIEKEKLLENINLTPFLESISEQKKMSLLDYNFKPFNAGTIVFLCLVLVSLLIMIILTFTKGRNKIVKRNNKLIKACLVISFILLVVTIILLIICFYYSHKALKFENEAVCEATRIPHSLFYGNPEIHFQVNNNRNFVGLENIRKYLTTFENEKDSFVDGKNQQIIKDIKGIDFKTSIDSLNSVSDEFFDKHSQVQGKDASGDTRTPYSISYSLPTYKVYLTSMLDRYRTTADRIDKIELMEPIFTDKQKADSFFFEISKVKETIIQIEVQLSEYWNSLMNTSFDGILIFKMSVIVLAILTTLSVLALIILYIFFLKATKIGKIKNKKMIRCISILVLIMISLSIIALFEISRGVFTSYYGCSLMLKFKNNPSEAKTMMEPYLKDYEELKNLTDHCFFNPQPDSQSNFYELIPNETSKQTLKQYLSFFDGIKVAHENIKGVDKNTDKYYTTSFKSALETFLNGTSFDYDDVFTKYAELNYHFDCSDIFYSLSSYGCEKKPANRPRCVAIDTQEFLDHTCLDNHREESQKLFNNLKEYMESEKVIINNLIEDLTSSSNPDAILTKINDVIHKFELVDDKIQSLETDLDSHINTLRDGPIETWLDCQILKTDLERTYNKMCQHKIYEVSSVVQIFVYTLLLVFFLAVIVFWMTSYFEDLGEYSKKLEGDKNESSNVFDDGYEVNEHQEFGTMEQNTEDKTFDNDSKPMFNNFNTFKQPNIVQKNPYSESQDEQFNQEEKRPAEFETYGDSIDNDYKPSNIQLKNLSKNKYVNDNNDNNQNNNDNNFI